MRKKGMTLIESVVSIALLGVIFLLVAPLINSFGKVKNRVHTQKEIDRKFSIINEFIQKKIRSAKDISGSGQYAEIFDVSGNPTSRDGVELHLQIPIADSTTPDSVSFVFDSADNKLKYSNGSSTETLMESINTASFSFQEGIITYYIDLNVGDYEDKLRSSFRGSTSTRIDIK